MIDIYISHFGSDCEPVFPLWKSRPETAHLLTMSSECKSVIINTASRELPNKPKQVTQIKDVTFQHTKVTFCFLRGLLTKGD